MKVIVLKVRWSVKERKQNEAAVTGQLKIREAADTDAHAFAGRLLLGSQFLLRPLEDLRRCEQLARRLGGHIEFIKAELG